MKIVALSSGYIEGLEYQENIVVKYFEKFGHDVHVVTSLHQTLASLVNGAELESKEVRIARVGNTTIYRLPYRLNIKNRIQTFRGFAALLEEIKPDLIFVHNAVANIIDCARYVRRHPACRMVMDFHGDFSNSGRGWVSKVVLHGIVNRRIVQTARPQLSKIFPVTPKSADFLSHFYKVKPEEMELLPLGADVDTGQRIKDGNAPARLRRAYGIPDSAIVIFSGGKLQPAKRVEVLIDAVNAMKRDDVYVMIVGDAPKECASYKALLIDRAGGNERIRFTGWLTPQDIYAHMALADIAAFPASQSILWQQSIAMGLPLIVGSTSGGEQDVSYLNTHDNILIGENDDALQDEFAGLLGRVIDSPDLRKRMADGATKTAGEMLDWNVLIHRILRFNV